MSKLVIKAQSEIIALTQQRDQCLAEAARVEQHVSQAQQTVATMRANAQEIDKKISEWNAALEPEPVQVQVQEVAGRVKQRSKRTAKK